MYPSKPKPAEDPEIDLDQWDQIVAEKYKVPHNLMKAMAKQESGGDVNATSPTGVKGRYQVTRRAAAKYKLDRDDPFQQSVAAARYLRDEYDALKDIKDDNERWLGAVGRYYAGPNAVQGDELSNTSVDGVSNPVEHVTRVAKNWGAINKGTAAQPTPQPAPKRGRTPATSRALTPQQPSPFSIDAPTGFQQAEQSVRGRTAQFSPEAQAEANLRNQETTRFQGLSRTGQALDVVKAGATRGAQGLGNMMRAAGAITTGRMGAPALSPETETGLQRREAAQDVTLPNTAPVGRGVTSGAIQAVPMIASGGAGAAAPFIMGAATQAANEDWSQPGRALARTALGAAVPAVAGKAATALLRPATRAGQVAAGTVGGAAGNVGTAAAEQAAFDGKLNAQNLAQQAVIGGALGGVTPPPKYRARQSRAESLTPDQVFQYDADGNRILPSRPPATDTDAVQRVPQVPFDPNLAAPDTTLSPEQIRAQYRRDRGRPIQEKLAGPPRETTALRRTQGIERTELLPTLPDAPATTPLPPDMANAPTAEAAPVSRPNPVRDALRSEADAAKIEAAGLEQAGRAEEAAIKYDAAHRALTRLRRNIGTPKTEADAALLGQLDTEISAAAQNRANARGGRRRPRTTAPEEVRTTGETKGITSPLLKDVSNPEGGVPRIPTEKIDFTRLAARQERGQDNPLANKSILARIRELGGIKPGQDSGELIGAKDKRYPGLINRRGGIAPDELIQYLAEDGYPVDRNDLNTLWKAIDDDVAGRNVRPLDRVMNTEEVMGEGYTDYLRGRDEETRPSSEPLPSGMFGNKRAQEPRANEPFSQSLLRTNQGEPGQSLSPFAQMVQENKALVDKLYATDLTSPEGQQGVQELRQYMRKNDFDQQHVNNLIAYMQNDQAHRPKTPVTPVVEPKPVVASERLPQPTVKPASELAYKGGTAPLDTTQPEQFPQMPAIQDLPTKGLSRIAEMSRPEVEQALADAEAVRNREIRNPQMSAAEIQANRETLDAAKARRREFVEQDTQWGKSEFADEARAFKKENGRFPKDLAELRRGGPKTEALPEQSGPKIQHERFGEVQVVEKAPGGKLVVEDADGQTHTVKDPRRGGGNRIASYARKPLTEELSIPVAEQVGVLPESAVEPRIVAEARNRLRQASTGQVAGSGSRALFDQAIVTGYQVYKAGMAFKDWSAEVVKSAGSAVSPHLRRAWAEIQKFHRDEGGSAKVGPGQPEPQSQTARSTRNLASIRMEDLGTGGPRKRTPRREVTLPTPETMRRAGLRDITPESLRAREAERSPAEAQEAAKPDGFLKSLSAYRKASMLTKPVTHITNMISNAGFQVSEEVARIPAGIADMAMSAVTGKRTVAGMNPAAFGRATYEAATRGVKEARQILKTGRSSDEIAKNIDLEELASKSKILNTYVNTVFRALKAEDQLFKTYAMRRSLESQAKVMALNDAREGTISRSKVADQTKSYIENPTSEMSTQAILDAEVATFQNDNKFSSALASGRAELGDVGNFAIDMVLPFSKTPTNIIARTLEMTPLGYGKNAAQVAKAIVNKSFTEADQRSFATTFGRASVGSGLILLGYGLAAKGMMTGLPDTDWRKRAQDESKAPHAAILDPLTDRWFSLTRLSPIGTLLAIGATLHRDMHEKAPTGKSRAGNVIGGVGQVILDQPMLRAAKEVSDMISEPDRTPTKAGRMASSFIPAVVDDVGNLTDKVQRKPGTFREAIKGRIPGLRQSLKPRTNAAGQPIKTELTDVIDPFRSRSRSQTGTDLERRMIDLNVGGMEPKQKPGEPENVYRDRVEKSQGWFQKYGAELVSDPAFNSLSSDQQEKAIENLRQRIGAQANQTRPNERGFAASQIIRGVRSAERNRERNRGKFIWTPPEE